jgi:hypothetical protein
MNLLALTQESLDFQPHNRVYRDICTWKINNQGSKKTLLYEFTGHIPGSLPWRVQKSTEQPHFPGTALGSVPRTSQLASTHSRASIDTKTPQAHPHPAPEILKVLARHPVHRKTTKGLLSDTFNTGTRKPLTNTKPIALQGQPALESPRNLTKPRI